MPLLLPCNSRGECLKGLWEGKRTGGGGEQGVLNLHFSTLRQTMLHHLHAKPAVLPTDSVKLDRTTVCVSSCKQQKDWMLIDGDSASTLTFCLPCTGE